MSEWRDDEHLQVGSPSMTLIPPTVVHTTRAVGPGAHTLIDVFARRARTSSRRVGTERRRLPGNPVVTGDGFPQLGAWVKLPRRRASNCSPSRVRLRRDRRRARCDRHPHHVDHDRAGPWLRYRAVRPVAGTAPATSRSRSTPVRPVCSSRGSTTWPKRTTPYGQRGFLRSDGAGPAPPDERAGGDTNPR
ncbi:hypothetical protein NKH77_52745 [Streptomyces sp. M19]